MPPRHSSPKKLSFVDDIQLHSMKYPAESNSMSYLSDDLKKWAEGGLTSETVDPWIPQIKHGETVDKLNTAAAVSSNLVVFSFFLKPFFLQNVYHLLDDARKWSASIDSIRWFDILSVHSTAVFSNC